MGKKLKIDFGDVEAEIRHGGGAAHVPEGDYLAKVVQGKVTDNKSGDGRHIAWRLQIVGPNKKYKGKTLYTRTTLKRTALWSLRNFIHAAIGKNVAGKTVNFDPDSLVGKIVAVTVEDEEYDGKMRSNIVDVRPKEELETDDDEDEDEDSDEEEEETEEEDEDEDLEEVDVEDI